MATYQKFDVLKYSIIGGIAGVISYILAVIFPLLGLPTTKIFSNNFVSFTASMIDIDLRNQILQTGYFNAVGENVFNLLNAVHFNYMSFLGIVLGAILTVFVGRLIVGFVSNKYLIRVKVWLSFIIGCAVLGVVASLYFSINLFATIGSLAVYGFLLGMIMQIILSAKKLKYLND